MYTTEDVKRQLKAMGVDGFITWISNAKLSNEAISSLEKIHVFSGGFLCLSMIYFLAKA